MSPTTDPYQADCGLCAAVVAAHIEKATKAEEPPSSGNKPKTLQRRVDTTWDPVKHPKLNVSFVNDVPQTIKDSIINYAKEWMRPDTPGTMPCISLQYHPKYDRKHEIRIHVLPRIKKKASSPDEKNEYYTNQSYYGNLSIDHEFDDTGASMELAILDVEDKEDEKGVNMFRRRVLHEFGHAFSFMHEQAREDFKNLIVPSDSSDKAADAKTKPADTTTKPVVNPAEKSALQKQADLIVNKQLIATGVADRKSIMMYPFLTVGQLTDGTTIPWNTKLSDEDRRFAKLIYPPTKK